MSISEVMNNEKLKALLCEEAWILLDEFVGDNLSYPSPRHEGDVLRFKNFIHHVLTCDKHFTLKDLYTIVCEKVGWSSELLGAFEKSLDSHTQQLFQRQTEG